MPEVPSGFKLHEDIERALSDVPESSGYDFVVKKDHLFLRVPGYPLIIICGRGLQRRTKPRTIKNAVSRLHRLARAINGEGEFY